MRHTILVTFLALGLMAAGCGAMRYMQEPVRAPDGSLAPRGAVYLEQGGRVAERWGGLLPAPLGALAEILGAAAAAGGTAWAARTGYRKLKNSPEGRLLGPSTPAA